ncbi:MAG: exosortase-dependent surface protein XDP1, partial [Variovorax sp.]
RSKATWGLMLGLSLCFSAHAVDTWTYTGVSGSAGVDSASAGAATLTTIGAFATNTGTSGLSGSWSTNTVGTPSAALQFYSDSSGVYGLGMGSDGTGTPNHAIDNNGTYTEGVLLSFSSSTILTGIDLGYVYGDADISVFRYTGTTEPTVSGVGASLSAMSTAGWQLVGNYANLTADNTSPYAYNLINGATDADPTSGVTPTASSSSVGSSWWLITAYNTAFGTGTGLTQGDDYFKLLAVAGTACTGSTTKCGGSKVPEPTPLALACVALLGVAYTRRRRNS